MVTTEKKLWSSFAGYRKQIAEALKASGAPTEFVYDVGNTGYEGEVAAQLFYGFEIAEDYLRDMKKPKYSHLDLLDFWMDAVGTVHDAVINAAYEYENIWNYEPGHSIEKAKDSKKLAEDVENYLQEKLKKLFASASK